MKTIFTPLPIITAISIFTITASAQAPNSWTQKANFGGSGRIEAVGFSIGTHGYIGTGYDATGYRNDFWEYDPSSNIWTQKANFGGAARYSAVGFSIGTKGYIGTGNNSNVYFNDFWEYNPSSNTWTQKANFGGGARSVAAGFSIGTKGYIGTGTNSIGLCNDFWEYDPSTNIWIQKANFNGTGRMAAVGFSIGAKGYLGTGHDGSYTNDFWEYNPLTNLWTQKANFGGTARLAAIGFSIGAKGYLGTGDDGSKRNDFWEYDPSSDTWTQKANFGGTARDYAACFSIVTLGYIGTGYDGSYTKDFWEYNSTCISPAPPTNTTLVANQTICSGHSTVLSASGSGTLGWYSAATGGSWLGSGTSYTTPVLTTSTTYYVQDSTCAASSTRTSIAVTVNPLPAVFNVTGGGSYCLGGTGLAIGLSGSVVGINYALYNGITLVTTLPGTGITLNFGLQTSAGIYTVVATNATTSCTNNMNGNATIMINSLPTPSITGPTSVCVNSTGNVYTTQAGMVNYVWSVSSGGSITAGGSSTSNSITVTWNTVGAQFVGINYTDANGCTAPVATTFNVTVHPRPVPVISGPNSVCVGSTGNVYSTQTGMSGYTWGVSAGGIITGSTGTSAITVTWNTVGAQTVSVNYNNVYGCSALLPTVYSVTVSALPVPTISGPASVCAGSTANVYTTQAGMINYIWTVSAGGTITAGGTTTDNIVTVTWNNTGAQTVSVNYTNTNGCTAYTPAVNNVTVNPPPVPTITGQTSMCVNSGYYYYTTESGMLNYLWGISSGGNINYGSGTNQVQVSWIIAGPQTISVTYTNGAGCNPLTPTVLNVMVGPLPGPAGSITGIPAVCAGANGVAYSVATIPYTTTYVWTLPPNATIASGFGTNSITANFAANATSGDIIVYGNNLCGNGPSSPAFHVTIAPLPGPAGIISGPADVCMGDSGIVYFTAVIPNATGYTWTVPAGVTITGGNNTNSITVTFTANAVSGNINVMGTNSCGDGTVSPDFAVTVNPIPQTPVVTNTGDTLHSSVPNGNQWYFEGTLLAGATGQNYVATQTGHYWDIVTINGCSSDSSNYKLIVITSIMSHPASVINLFPVPSDGQLNFSITTTSKETFSIIIYNTLGIKIFEETAVNINGSMQKMIDLRSLPDGIYTVIFENSHNRVVKKIILNK